MFAKMMEKFVGATGFLAALDQSGGSTPRALELYGVPPSAYSVGDASMFDAVHEMRKRIVTSPSFDGDRILGAILFEDTMNRTIVDDQKTAEYLWKTKQIIPFLKVDRGLEAQQDGVQIMKPIPDLDLLLQQAKDCGVFGTKMRSVIHCPNEVGIQAVVQQQFDVAKRILNSGLVPIVEPEVSIKSDDKEACERLLKDQLLQHLDQLGDDQNIVLKLSLPCVDNFYQECIRHARCLRVVALSGGYSQQESIDRLARQNGMIASFSRSLTEGLKYEMSDEEFNDMLRESISTILAASTT